MKIVSWNCDWGFTDNKQSVVKNYDADILVIPECRELDMKGYGCDENHRDWFGDHLEATTGTEVNKKKDLGIGLFWKDGITVNRLPEWDKTLSNNSDFRYLVPYRVSGNFEPFTLIAVWTKDKYIAGENDRLDYERKAYAAVDHYKDIGLLNGRVLLIGDFNTFAKKDNDSLQDLEKNMRPLINCAKDSRFRETYTYYHNKTGKYGTNDFCFASENLMKKKTAFNVYSDWKNDRWNGSDHCPISVEFEL